MVKKRILLIEDNLDVQDGLSDLLSKKYTLSISSNGLDGITEAIRNPPDLILLDLRMPKLNGFDACKAIRDDRILQSVPIIVLTAYNTTKDRQKAFANGADDFVAKPFNTKELLIRIDRKISTHYPTGDKEPAKNQLVSGDITIDLTTQTTYIKNKAVVLSNLEFRLLKLFIQHHGKLLDRSFILEEVWQNKSGSDRIMAPHIVSLRSKLANSSEAIVSVYKGGYVLKSKA